MESQPTPILEETEKNKKQPLRSKNCFISWRAIGLLLVTLMSLLVGLSYFWFMNREQLNDYQSQLSILQKQISQNLDNDKNRQQQILQLQNFIEQKFSSTDNAILLGNINQLIQLAQYNLVYFHDADNALSALTLADQWLSAIVSPDIRFENLHQLLTQYLTHLKAFPHIDLPNILAQLQSLKLQIAQLPLLPNSNSLKPTTPEAATNNLQENKWTRPLKNSLDSFRQLIVIRRLNKPIEPLLPEIEQQYLQHNLLLLLQQAQWTLIHHEPAIYQSSLQEIQETIKDHFATNSLDTQTVLQSINQLKQVNLQIPSLDLNPLLEAISIIKKTPSTTNANSVISDNPKGPS